MPVYSNLSAWTGAFSRATTSTTMASVYPGNAAAFAVLHSWDAATTTRAGDWIVCSYRVSTATAVQMPVQWLVRTDDGLARLPVSAGASGRMAMMYAATNGTLYDGPYLISDPAALATWRQACADNLRGILPADQALRQREADQRARAAMRESQKRRRETLARGRKVLRRSVEIYARIRGREEISQFVAGKEICIAGARFDYRARKDRSLIWHSGSPIGAHTPFRLHLHARGDEEPIAAGCIYIHETPVVDQLLALALNVQDADDEKELLRKANWTVGTWRLTQSQREAQEMLRALRSGRSMAVA